MSTILNVIWFVLAGLWLAIGYFVAGLIFCIFIVTIPFGIANMRLAGLRAVAVRQDGRVRPFGRVLLPVRATSCGSSSSGGNSR